MTRSIATALTLLLAVHIFAESINRQMPLRGHADSVYFPLVFEAHEENLGKTRQFLSRGPGYTMQFEPQSVTIVLRHGNRRTTDETEAVEQMASVRIAFPDSSATTQVVGVEELPQKVNYFVGNDPARWRSGISTYNKLLYKDVYPGTDLIFYGSDGTIEYDFKVKAGANPDNIRMLIQGANAMNVEKDGTLTMQTEGGAVHFRKPLIYQETNFTRKHIDGHFLVHPVGVPAGKEFLVSFEVGLYDRANTLTIDPVVEYSTYLGGSRDDYAYGITVDSLGNKYVVGETTSLDFPIATGAIGATCSGSFCDDAFIAKINPDGTGLIYATYLGGGQSDFGIAVATDPDGNAYVTGGTQSIDFPTTVGAFKRTCGGTCFGRDGFVAKLNPSGSALLYSTYLGGNDEDFSSAIGVFQGKATVAGFSRSSDFPTTIGAYRTQVEGAGSSFVEQLNSDGSALSYATFLGQVDLQDAGPKLSLDGQGNTYLVGDTVSANFPVTTGAFHTSFQAGLNSNLYISKLNADGTALLFSALIGGAGITGGSSVDSAGNTYFAAAAGTFFPVTPGAVEQSCDNGILMGKLSADGSTLLASAHLCPERAWPSIAAFDNAGSLLAGGYTDSTELTTTVGARQVSIRNICCFSDGFLTRLSPDASAITYSTYLGGNLSDAVNAAAIDTGGNLYVAGYTTSSNFLVRNPLQPTNAGSADAFVSKIVLPRTKLSLYPAIMTFRTHGLGIPSAPQQVSVANVTTAAIPISGVSVTGDFSVTSTCGSQLAAGAQCNLAVTFSPTAVGKRTGTLTLIDALGSQKVKLQGTGANGPVVEFLPVATIKNQPFGTTSPPLAVTVNNVGNADLVITSISLTNGPTFNFDGPTTCFVPIPPKRDCRVQITYTPSFFFGSDFANLTFSDNSKNGTDGVGLFGEPAFAQIALSSTGVRFNQQVVRTKSPIQKITFTNGSSAPITISKIKASPGFVQTHTCGAMLAPGAFCYINVAFKPQSVGIQQGAVTVMDDGVGGPHVLPLLGTGRN